MERIEYHWRTDDGVELFGQGWLPAGAPKAAVCLVHGLGEHSGRYAHVAEALNQAGYALLGFDLRGHGRSGGPRGHAPSLEAWLCDIDRLLEEASQRFPGTPRFVYGHSLGGILVLDYVLLRRPALAGAIVTSPGLHTAIEQQKVKVALSKVLGRWLPGLTLASGLNPQHLSRDPQVVRAYVDDPLVHDRLTAGSGYQLLKGIQLALERAAEFPLPLLLMHGTQDQLCFPSSSTEVAEAHPGDCTLKVWEGGYHELHNEPEKQAVLRSMTEWLDKHLPQ